MSTPTDKAEDTAIDAIMEQAQVFASTWALVGSRFDDGSKLQRSSDDKNELEELVRRAIQAAKAEADHFKSHFTKLAKVNAAANAALDTARREWAKKVEG